MQSKKRALGKGLGALLPVRTPEPITLQAPIAPAPTLPQQLPTSTEALVRLPIEDVTPNPYQPRDVFDEQALEDLAASIRAHGIIQPIAVTKRDGRLIIVAGERRWRAAHRAGLSEIPVIQLNLTDQEILEFALIENLQREDLNPLEEARAYRALIDTFGLSQEEVADRVGKGRPTIANAMRLLKLPVEFQADLESGLITPGHARAILSLENEVDQRRLRNAIVNNGLSVRDAEKLAQQLANRASTTKPRAASEQADPHVRRLREQLIDHLACRVDLKTFDQGSGKIEVYYDSLDELERILGTIGVEV